MTPPATKKRPMAAVRRVTLFSREIIERLSPAGLDLLLARATRLSEGQVSATGDYFGSTMITVDLAQVDGKVRDACDVATAARLARRMAGDQTLVERVRVIAREEAPLGRGAAEVRTVGLDDMVSGSDRLREAY